MKKIVLASAALAAVMAFTSCGSSKESAYRKAYEKAKAQEMAQTQETTTTTEETEQDVIVPSYEDTETPVVTQLVEAPAQTKVTDNNDNVPVRAENLKVVNGDGLKAYSVVVGAFGQKANADGLQARLKKEGHNAQVAYNESNKMYRVIISTFDTKASAVSSRNSVSDKFPGAWLLMKQ